MAFDYFYDGQIRRFLTQIVRAFSGFQYQVGGRDGAAPYLQVVPCRMATQNRQVGHIMKNNSENTILSVPLITVFIKEMSLARDRTQAPGHVSTVQVTERKFSDTNGEYTGEKGNGYTVDRIMPHPLNVTIQVDAWTANEHQKHQLFEQIYMAFNVGFDIQSSENPIDWTSLTTLRLDSLSWSSRSIPVGTNDEIDVMSFTFDLPVWISPPAKVKQQKIIQQIVTNILDGDVNYEDSPNLEMAADITGGTFLSRSIVTPDNAMIEVDSGEITLLGSDGSETDSRGNLLEWSKLLDQYGTLIPAQSQLRLRADIEQGLELDIVGTIQFHPTKPNVLIWQVDIDTLPSNTMSPVNAIIDPLKNWPGQGLPLPEEGHRYLILHDIGPSQAWGQITGRVGDVLEYRNSAWVVAFTASATQDTQHVVNLHTGKQLRFVDGAWIMSVSGVYNPGHWRLHL